MSKEISKIKLVNGEEFDIKDAYLRQQIIDFIGIKPDKKEDENVAQ